MINKITSDIEPILKAIPDGATIMTGGFGVTGQPAELIEALIDLGKKELTIVNNNAASGDRGLTNLIIAGCVKNDLFISEICWVNRFSRLISSWKNRVRTGSAR